MSLNHKWNTLHSEVENRKRLHKKYKHKERQLKMVVRDILEEEINTKNLAVSNAIYHNYSILKPKKEPLFNSGEIALLSGLFISLIYLLWSLI